MNTPFRKSFLFVPILATLLFSCGGPKDDKGEEVASVNGSPVYMKDFMKEVRMATKRDPGMKLTEERLEDILHTMVDRKLLIDEAVKKGLSEEERFLESIKSFWEQTLIRELIESKNREWADKLLVTDEEVKSRYELMRHRITLRVVKAHDMKEAEAALPALSSKGELMGPLFVEDLRHSDPFIAAFAMEKAAKAAVGSGDDFFAYEVVKKEPSGAPPLEEVYEALKMSLLEEKKEKALEDWLESRKKAAAISINEEAIERLK
jgi:uncharacterized protein YceH (UPF0502 family)